MNIVFLDINGVLDTNEKMDEIDSDNLNRLKSIVDATNSKVVISSSLKNSYYYTGHLSKHLIKIIKEIKEAGIEVTGITPKCNSRTHEIMQYLKEHPEIENYCILDDDYDMEELKDNLVKLPPQIEEGQKGLEDIHVDKAIKILKRKK